MAEVAAMSSVPLRKADSRHVKYGKCTLKAGYSSIAHCSYELAVHSLGPCWQVRTPPLYLALPNGTTEAWGGVRRRGWHEQLAKNSHQASRS